MIQLLFSGFCRSATAYYPSDDCAIAICYRSNYADKTFFHQLQPYLRLDSIKIFWIHVGTMFCKKKNLPEKAV